MKLHLGCGNHILPGFINVDIAPLPGVNRVVDLATFPWPFEDSSVEEIQMHNILEHLPDVFRTMEEIYRISQNGAKVVVTVPYYNSLDHAGDPSHLHAFSQFSFNFFDERTPQGKERPYYSIARFRIKRVYYHTTLAGKWVKSSNPFVRSIMSGTARFLSNIIRSLTFELEAKKDSVPPAL